MIFSIDEERKRDIEAFEVAVEKCRTAAIAEFASITKARSLDKEVDSILSSLERTGDFRNSFSYIFLRNIHAVCGKFAVEYVGDIKA